MTGRIDEARAVAAALREAVDRQGWDEADAATINRWEVLIDEDSARVQAADLLEAMIAYVDRLQAEVDDYRRRAVTDDFGDVRLLDQG